MDADYLKAYEYFRRAADAGSLTAVCRMADLFREGLGLPRDDAQAEKLYRAVAEAGNAEGMNKLALMLLTDGALMRADPEAGPFAMDLFRRAMARRDPALLGFGTGMSAGEAGAPEESAAALDAANNYSLCLEEGIACERDYAAAQACFQIAAAQGHVAATANLAALLVRRKHFVEASRHFRDAAALGHAEALAGLAMLLEVGKGCPKDVGAAEALFDAAEQAGFKPAGRALHRLTAARGAASRRPPKVAGLSDLLGAGSGNLCCMSIKKKKTHTHTWDKIRKRYGSAASNFFSFRPSAPRSSADKFHDAPSHSFPDLRTARRAQGLGVGREGDLLDLNLDAIRGSSPDPAVRFTGGPGAGAAPQQQGGTGGVAAGGGGGAPAATGGGAPAGGAMAAMTAEAGGVRGRMAEGGGDWTVAPAKAAPALKAVSRPEPVSVRSLEEKLRRRAFEHRVEKILVRFLS